MTDKRITKKDNFTELRGLVMMCLETEAIDVEEFDRLTAFIDNELSLLAKKHGAKSGPTKTQLENDTHKSNIVALLTESEPMKATAIGNALGLSVQKASALLRQLVATSEVERVESGKDTFFSVS